LADPRLVSFVVSIVAASIFGMVIPHHSKSRHHPWRVVECRNTKFATGPDWTPAAICAIENGVDCAACEG
jgi:hypothetical protein